MRIGKWVNLGFKIAGAAVALSPAIGAVQSSIGDPANIPRATAKAYTGFDVSNPSAGVDVGQLSGGIAAIAAGVILAKVGGFLGKRF
jgi:hypothetical protein